MKQDTPIRNISDLGRKPGKGLKYEVCLVHGQDEAPESIAKFKSYGDCMLYAIALSKAPVSFHEILIR